jgi:DSF synthase
MGFPEVLFDLFPGMGAYSFLCRRVSPALAERLMLDGNIYTSEQMHAMGVIDVLVPKGQGVQAVQDLLRSHRRAPHARMAMQQVRQFAQPVSLEELMRITEIWVDTAMQLGEKSLRTMERLVRAQERRSNDAANATSLAASR